MKNLLQAWLPFLRWFPMSGSTLRADLFAGITIALILVPQSMAYAQLAGLPVVYGLYASFVPVIVASLWGSSNQLHTGPVAMLSLMSAAALIPFATPGSAGFIELSIMLAMMVGILRLALGVFRLGAIVNFLSSPVIVGFTNAAALIIGLSQLSKIIGVPFPRSDVYLMDLWGVLTQIPYTHWGTLAFAVVAWILIASLRRVSAAVPGVLVAVVVTTVFSAMLNFEHHVTVDLNSIEDQDIAQTISAYRSTHERIEKITHEISVRNNEMTALLEKGGLENINQAEQLRAQSAVLQYELKNFKAENNQRRIQLHTMTIPGSVSDSGELIQSTVSAEGNDIENWRFDGFSGDQVLLKSGGAVVGDIPKGLPSFNVPTLHWDLMLALLPAALVMALIGFMEATSISKAIAATTGEQVNTSKELVGQGLANIAGSFFGSYTVSGSFSRSAVAARSGAKTGLFAIISALAVVAVLLFFTTYLYHLPQAVLAVIVMMAVFSLIKIRPLIHAWKIDRTGAMIGVITFISTLLMAPAIANGILIGIGLTVLHFLIKTMRPRAEIVARKADGTLGGIRAHRLTPISQYFVPVRFDGSLTFNNVAYFEDMLLKAHSEFPDAKIILVIGSGINEVDASGEEKIREVVERFKDVGVTVMFSGLKHQVMRIFERSGLVEDLGQDAFFTNKETALLKLSELFQSPANEQIDPIPTGKSGT